METQLSLTDTHNEIKFDKTMERDNNNNTKTWTDTNSVKLIALRVTAHLFVV